MAKKRRIIQEQAEEEEITIDDTFDEKEFILGDMYGTKVLVAVFIMAIISGIVFSWIYGLLPKDGNLGVWVCLIISVAIMYFMKPLLTKLGFHMDMLEAKTMIGHYIMYFLLMLGVWTLCINPPFV